MRSPLLINTVLASYKLSVKYIILARLFFLTHLACAGLPENNNAPPILYSYQVIRQYPHASNLFTQGLEFSDGFLYESSGLYGRSTLTRRTLNSSQVLMEKQLEDQYFAEGITLLNGKIYQLTWRSKTVFVYDKETFKQIDQFKLSGEGWGLANNGKYLILSNGSDQLQFIDPDNFNTVSTITVGHKDKTIDQLNELEWVNGLIYANVWQTADIVIIHPENGQLLGWVNLDALVAQEKQSANADVLNGIAYDKANNRLLVTGKYWRSLYHIELTPRPFSKNTTTR